MKIMNRGITPDGIEIQLEDWREHYPDDYPIEHGYMIGAYPVASATIKSRWVKSGELFRLSITASEYTGYTNAQLESDYNALKQGTKTLAELSSYFLCGKDDMYCLGI